MARVVDILKSKHNDGSVKFIFLMFRNAKGGAPTRAQLKDYETKRKFGEHAFALSDGKMRGVVALWSRDAQHKNTMVMSRGYKIFANHLKADEIADAVEAALKE